MQPIGPTMLAVQRLCLAFALFFLLGGPTPFGFATGNAQTPVAGDAPIFIPVDRITVAVFRDGEVAQHLIFILKLEVTDRAASGQVIEKMPRLTDAFMRDLHKLASSPQAAQDGLDVTLAKRRLLASSVRVLGPNILQRHFVIFAPRRGWTGKSATRAATGRASSWTTRSSASPTPSVSTCTRISAATFGRARRSST